MRIPALIVFFTLSFYLKSHGQIVTLSDHEHKAKVGAQIQLRPVNTSAGMLYFITGENGKVDLALPPEKFPAQLTITCIGQTTIIDTLYSTTDKQYTLQPASKTISEFVVTGQYAPDRIENSVHRIEVIDRKKIDGMGAQNLRDVLTNQLNVRLSQDAVLGSSMSLQGMGGEGVKILIDGVPVIGKHNGSIDLSQIELNNIERIEIIEGPMAVSYGTDAIAGTINLITKKNLTKKLSVGLTGFYETAGNYNINGKIGLHRKKHTIIFTGGRNFFTGWSPGNGVNLFDFKSNVADSTRFSLWKPKEQYNAAIQYSFNTETANITYSGKYFQEQIINKGYPSAPYGESAFDGYYHSSRTGNAVTANKKLAKNKTVKFLLSYNTYTNTNNTYFTDLTTLQQTLTNADGNQDTNKFHQFSSRASFSKSTPLARLNYEVGYDLNLQTAKSNTIRSGTQKMQDYAIFASAEYLVTNKLKIRPGLRGSYNSRYGAPVIPSINMLYSFNDQLKIRASVSKGFRTPTLQELYFYFVDVNHNIVGNPDLKAETSYNYNLSAGWSFKMKSIRFKTNLSGFYNDISNIITLAQKSSSNEYTYVNIGKVRTKGVQLNITASTGNLNVSLGGSYTGINNNLPKTTTLPTYNYSPEFQSSVFYNFKKPQITAGIFYKHNGKTISYKSVNNSIEENYIDAYSLIDASVTKNNLSRYINITVGVKNLMNIQNVNALGSASFHSSGEQNVAIGMGRTVFLKFDLKLDSKN